MIRFNVLVLMGFFLLHSISILAQVKQDGPFLLNVGKLDSIYSQSLQEYRTFYIQLPNDYRPESNKKYPVAYVLDGEVLLPTVADVQSYYSGGFTPEMVLVGISNAKNRVRDLTTSNIQEKYGMPFTIENGQAVNFIKFLEEELIPYIDKSYLVTNYRTLIGHSYGGLFTIYTLVHRADLFANYLAIDPSLDWDDQRLVQEAQTKFSNSKYFAKSLFVSLSGQLHMQNAAVTIDNVMQDSSDYTLFARSNIAFSNMVQQNVQNGLEYHWKFYPNDLHGTVAFPSIMDGLINIFTWYQMENTDKINSFDTPKNELLDIVRSREEKLEKHFGYPEPPYPEDLLNMSGYMNMEMNQSSKAKMYFELAIEYYPFSANAYDSMADFYEAQGDIDTAIQYVQKASELSDDPYYKDRLKLLGEK